MRYERPAPEPPVELPASFTRTGAEVVPELWWTVLGDAQLEHLVQQALAGNMTLQQAWDRLDQAHAILRREGAELHPSLTGTAGASRTVLGTPAGDRSYVTDMLLGLGASYEVDLWGRIRAGQAAAAQDVLASSSDLQTAAITLSAAVAQSWYRVVELRGQVALLEGQKRTNADYLESISLRFRRGRVPAVDVLQQRLLLESVEADLIRVHSALRLEHNRLAVLLGRAPGEFRAPPGRILPALPPLPATGPLASWLQRRPDLQAALQRVQAADWRTAEAVADRFPRVSLSGGVSTSAESLRTLFDSWLASLAADLVAPLLDGGRRAAEVDRTRAVVSQRLHEYGQVLLQAMEEVENALVQEARQRDLLQSLERQLALAERSEEQTLEGYKKGTMDFQRLLTSVLARQQLQRTDLQARLDLVLLRINLYRALGGGWVLHPGGSEP
jgi:NodT family efflux transporter outer membrane factor (OMF) lipoprotein